MTVQLDSMLEKVAELPVLPSTSAKIMTIVTDSDSTVDDILDVVKYDQALTSQVLRLCNSAYFGLSRKIVSLRDALAYLGAMPLLQVILGVHCRTVLGAAQPGYDLLPGMLWRHSCAVGLASDRIGRAANVKNPEGMFTCGLLHDIGKIIMGSFMAEAYQKVIGVVEEGSKTFLEAEKEVLGYTHAEVGEVIVRQWHLPEQIACTVRYHHEPAAYSGEADPIMQCVQIVHLGDSLALTLGFGVGNDELLYSVDSELAGVYGLGEKEMELIGVEVLSGILRIEEVFAT